MHPGRSAARSDALPTRDRPTLSRFKLWPCADTLVYILANRRYGILYVGLTNDLHRRMFQHRAKAVPGFTREHGVIRLVYLEEYASITEARARERSLKRWRRAWKLKLIDDFNPEWRDLAEDHVLPA